jgi:group I intron endonuclease
MEIRMIIYCVTNKINGKQYIGQTIQSLADRWYHHTYYSNFRNNYFHNAIKKYGKENFEIKQIDRALTIEELNEKEKYWIKTMNTIVPNGYNLTMGGRAETPGHRHSNKTKELLRKIHSGRYPSKETREKLSKIHKDLWNNETFREKIRLAHIGTTHSDDTKEKIRNSNIGKHTYLKDLPVWNTGKSTSDEIKKKISESMVLVRQKRFWSSKKKNGDNRVF